MNPLHIFGVCFPHQWGRWAVRTPDGWRDARKGEYAISQCGVCNAEKEGYAR